MHTTGSLAEHLKAELVGPADLAITHLDTLERAGPGAMTFIRSESYASMWAASKASAAMVTRGLRVPGHDPAARALLLVPDADLALNAVLELFAHPPRPIVQGRHPTAFIDPSAAVHPTASIGPCCVVGAGATLAEGVILMANVTIGPDASVGRGTVLHPGVVIGERCVIGAGCIFHGGVVIGADGFGYRPGPRGPIKIPHIGNVEIGDAVEIGANSNVDRAKFGSTIIGAGTKMDNLVQVAHNCRIGRGCLICGVTGIAGSVTIGDGVIIAGHVGIADNLTIGERAVIAAKSGVIKSVPAGETWWGFPAAPSRDAARAYAMHANLPDIVQRLRRVEQAVGIDPDEKP
jgi:UDP-3-O-[3-hydroxymyristoyl] glucosamine N-acyltransferase